MAFAMNKSAINETTIHLTFTKLHSVGSEAFLVQSVLFYFHSISVELLAEFSFSRFLVRDFLISDVFSLDQKMDDIRHASQLN